VKFRSNFEAGFARTLSQQKVAFSYESVKIPFQPNVRMYNPDFYITDYDFYVETKGRLTQDDRTKHILIKEQNPEVDVRFIFMNANKKIYKGSKTTYGMWCDRHGFQWAERGIPKEWLDGR
tara:strand:+ start:18 stop:380 length:363 start_codon:yes stop_codon:yes gene_type:complete